MKLLLVLALCLVATNVSDAFLGGFGEILSQTAKSLLSTLDKVGGNLLQSFLSSGKNLLSQSVQALALNTMTALKGQAAGKRELSAIMDKFHGFETKVYDVLSGSVKVLKPLLSNAISSFSEIMNKLEQYAHNPSLIVDAIDKVTGLHNAFVDTILTKMVSKVTELASEFFPSHKRNAFTEGFASIINQLKTTFGPALNGVKQMVSTTAGLLKNVTSNLFSALKDAGGDILSQALMNAKPVVDQIKGTLTNVLGGTR